MHGIAAALVAICQEEATEAAPLYNSTGASNLSAPVIVTTTFAGAVNPLTMIALLMDEAWRDATTNDDDMNLIVDALMSRGDI